MTQIPPRGTPEFEEYKKTVEEAHRKGITIQIATKGKQNWDDVTYASWKWSEIDYRIAPDQPQFTQYPEPSMTPTEQRIVKALEEVAAAIEEVYDIAYDMLPGGDLRVTHLEKYADKASKLVAALASGLPHPSPSEAPASPTAPAVEAGKGGSEAVAAFKSHGLASKPVPLQTQVGGEHYQNFPIQPVEFITANKLNFLEGCVIKRICRHRNKNGIEDLRKAIHEIELLIELEYGKEQG